MNVSNNELNLLSHSQEPLPNLPMVVDVGGDRYHMGNRHLNLGYNNYHDFIKTFGNDRETERILRQYLYLRMGETAGIEFHGDDGKKDKAKLVTILKKRLGQLKQNKNFTSSQLNKQKLQRIYANIQKILLDIGDAEMVANTISEECKKDKEALVDLSTDRDKIFQLVLEMTWYLFHPDKVPKDIECDWAAMVKKLEMMSVGDLVKSIKESDGTVSNNSFNYFKKIRLNEMAQKETLPNALEEAKKMVMEVEEETSDEKTKLMVPKLLQLLQTKRILQSADPDNLGEQAIAKADKWIMKNPFPPLSKKVTIVPSTQQGGSGLTSDFIQLRKSMYSAMTPLFDHFRIMYDPIYTMLEKDVTLKKDESINITHPIILLHLCIQLQKTVSKEGAYQYGIYRIRNVPGDLLGFIKTRLNRTAIHVGTMEDDTMKKQFQQQLFSLPNVRLSSLLTDTRDPSYKDPHLLPYLQFFVMGTNFTFPPEYPEFIHNHGKDIVEEDKKAVYDSMKGLFKKEDLYIVCTSAESAGLLGAEVNSSSKNIPMKNYEIDYRTVNPGQSGFTGTTPANYFNDAKKMTLYFEQMVKQKPYVIYNNAELALSILIAFKEHMPK
uniref:Uncharacterized protein n=1 Tax=viral metagenome TaxID=1070528 RepID=A0A6C0KQS2_9ZZZZ